MTYRKGHGDGEVVAMEKWMLALILLMEMAM